VATAFLSLFLERGLGLFMAIFAIFIPFYASLFPFVILNRIYRNRFVLHDRPRSLSEDNLMRLYWKTQRDLRGFLLSILFCFAILLLVMVLLLFLPSIYLF
jgi:hypothetical protein